MALEKRHCMNCEHSVFCDSWTEYKCLVKAKRIYEPDKEALRCKDFKKTPRKTALGEKEKAKCQCKTCQRRVDDE